MQIRSKITATASREQLAQVPRNETFSFRDIRNDLNQHSECQRLSDTKVMYYLPYYLFTVKTPHIKRY